ncbi:MAG: PEP-CTERM sorting domain-containing protein [Phycisphaerales bacterium]|nr:PEP-CTERM sorting domain-containing protein [Phycisphaerales bacterium]
MRYSAVLLAGVAGLASQASAQNFSLSLGTSVATLNPSGGTFTVTVYGDADVGTHMLGGAFSLVSNGDCISDMQWNPASWSVFNTDGGYAGSGDYNDVIFGQLVIPGIFPPAPGSELGSAIGSYTITLDPFIGDIALVFDLVAVQPFSLETVDAVTGQTYQSSSGNLSLGSLTIAVIPAPGTFAILGLGGLASARRRR